jgi:hypothetical protein
MLRRTLGLLRMSKILRTPLAVIATSFALRLFLIFRYRFDSDEPQHMHVAWGWAHGFMQYRDFFDNHMPVFHLLSAPLFLFADDDARLLFAARIALLPLFALALFLVWRIARDLFDERVAWWSAAFVALCPPFFLGSLEYRADDLWLVCWLALLAVLVSKLPRSDKDLAAGLLLGLAFGVSMKSVMFAVAIAAALIGTILLTRDRGIVSGRELARRCAVIMGIALTVPALIAFAFAMAGSWKPFWHDVFAHNQIRFEHAWRVLWFVPLYPVIRHIALAIAHSDGEAPLVRRRLFIFLTCAGYFLILVAFWPMTSSESYLPFYPLCVLLATPFILRRPALAPAVCALAFAVIVIVAEPWQNAARREIEMVTEVVSLTTIGEPVMDLKGETIFRVRPSYLVLEGITNAKLRLGLMRDSIAESLVRTGTHVVVGDALPPRTRRFVESAYVRWGSVYVAGVRLPQLRGDGGAASFNIAIPGPYVVLGDRGVIRAMIDGKWAMSGVDLKPGPHKLIVYERASSPVVIWSGALKRPLTKTRRDRGELIRHFLHRGARHGSGVEACEDRIEDPALEEFRADSDEAPAEISAQRGCPTHLVSESSSDRAELFDRHDGMLSFS